MYLVKVWDGKYLEDGISEKNAADYQNYKSIIPFWKCKVNINHWIIQLHYQFAINNI